MPLLHFTWKPGQLEEALANTSSSHVQGEAKRLLTLNHEPTPFGSKYAKLPLHLRSCLDYCCMFYNRYSIDRATIVRLLVAEGLGQQNDNEIVDDTAKKSIEELVSLGMLLEIDDGSELRVCKSYLQLCNLKLDNMQQFSTLCTNSHIRWLIVDDDPIGVPPRYATLLVRSLFSSSFENGFSMAFVKAVCEMKSLVVLDLDGKIEHLPDEVGELIHLVYLGLKNSELDELPKTIGDLHKLQTLEITMCGKLHELPIQVLGIQQLRHLIMSTSYGDCEIKVPKEIGTMTNLHTLSGLYAGGGIADELGNLAQLRELGVKRVSEDHATELSISIMKMVNLVSLSLEAEETSFEDTRTTLFPSMDQFSPPPLVQDLYLHGGLIEMPKWIVAMENLSSLVLSFSYLYENPSTLLQYLPSLKNLTLWEAYKAKRIGREFCNAGGFAKLECLIIASEFLEEWTEIEVGAFSSLKYLSFRNCMSLMFLPEGLQYTSTLQQLHLSPLYHYDLARRLKGEESYKIKHIPKVMMRRPFESTFPA